MDSLIDKTVNSGIENIKEYSLKDYASSDEVRWCPGCGDYAIYTTVKKVLANLNTPTHKLAFISGIGCSSRFPYYVNAYGLHGIHGRAPAIATGLKMARPDLSVWVVTGDGDSMSIGGNHFIHAMRRNIDLNVLLFNNEIYGLTKGQHSPTSKEGQITKSSPLGLIEDPFNATSLAMGAGASFVARTFDKDPKHMAKVFEAAARHKGTSFVEIYQNCVVFNDGAFDFFTRKEHRKEHVVYMDHGEPLIFGAKDEKGIIIDGFTPKIVELDKDGYTKDDLLIYNKNDKNLPYILSEMTFMEGFPKPVGIFKDVERETLDARANEQIERETSNNDDPNLDELFRGNATWTVL